MRTSLANVMVAIGTVAIVSLLNGGTAQGLPTAGEPGGASMKAGQMFTVKIVPKSKQIDVFVVGNDVAKAKFGELGLEASIKIGTRTFTFVPNKQKDHFSIFTPDFSHESERSDLLLKVRGAEKVEEFKFQLDQR
ncbi:hypothetical protein BH10BDE1_BH10BDE1_27590 [soil metagenome]